MLREHRRRAFGITLAAVGGFLLFMLLRGPGPIEPAPPNPFTSDFAVERIETGEPVPETVEIPVNTGFYASLRVAPDPDPPESLGGSEVQEPSRWNPALITYRHGSGPDSRNAIQHPFNLFPQRTPALPPPVSSDPGPPSYLPFGGVNGVWAKSGYRAPPDPPASFSEDDLCFWTYFAVPEDEPGDYVYEVVLYPCARWVSSFRAEFGPRVVLQRGLLRVLERED